METETQEHAVGHAVSTLIAAWNAGDAEAFAAAFTADADFTDVAGRTTSGRQSIRAVHEELFARLDRQAHLAHTQLRVRMLRPDIASVDCHWALTRRLPDVLEPLPRRHGLLHVILTVHEAVWAVVIAHNVECGAAAISAATWWRHWRDWQAAGWWPDPRDSSTHPPTPWGWP